METITWGYLAGLTAILFILYIPIWLFMGIKKRLAKKECMICHQLTRGETKVKGSLVIEIFLWMMFLIPGLLYTLWRSSSTEIVCSYCGNKYLKQLSKSDIQEIKQARKKAA